MRFISRRPLIKDPTSTRVNPPSFKGHGRNRYHNKRSFCQMARAWYQKRGAYPPSPFFSLFRERALSLPLIVLSLSLWRPRRRERVTGILHGFTPVEEHMCPRALIWDRNVSSFMVFPRVVPIFLLYFLPFTSRYIRRDRCSVLMRELVESTNTLASTGL